MKRCGLFYTNAASSTAWIFERTRDEVWLSRCSLDRGFCIEWHNLSGSWIRWWRVAGKLCFIVVEYGLSRPQVDQRAKFGCQNSDGRLDVPGKACLH